MAENQQPEFQDLLRIGWQLPVADRAHSWHDEAERTRAFCRRHHHSDRDASGGRGYLQSGYAAGSLPLIADPHLDLPGDGTVKPSHVILSEAKNLSLAQDKLREGSLTWKYETLRSRRS